MAKIYSLVLSLILVASLQAQPLSGVKDIPGDYPTLADAVTDVNLKGKGAGFLVFNVLPGNPQTAPAGGYVIGNTGSMVLTTSAPSGITFQGNGNTITASASLTAGALNDAIFKLVGADYITISNFVMLENPANTITAAATNRMTEWGVALLYVTTTNGAQNNQVENCVIDLDRSYQNTVGVYSSSAHSLTAPTTLASATGTAGGNHSLNVFQTTITDVNMGVVIIGPNAAADQTQENNVSQCTISNFGTTGTFSAYPRLSANTVNGIFVMNAVSYQFADNIITSSNGGTIAGNLFGINAPAPTATPSSFLQNNFAFNTISLRSGNASGTITGISLAGATHSSAVVYMDGNDFNNFGHTVAGTGDITFISQASPYFNQSINGSSFTDMNVNTTGSVLFISISNALPANGSKTVTFNKIVTGFTKTGAGGSVIFVNDILTGAAGSQSSTYSNDFSNVIVFGSTTVTGFLNNSVTSGSKEIFINRMSGITGGTGAIVGIQCTGDLSFTSIARDTISNITSSGSITAINFGNNTNNVNSLTYCNANVIHGLFGSTSGAVTGIITTGSPTAGVRDIYQNKIYNLENADPAGTVNGVVVAGGFRQKVFNNLLADLRTPASTALSVVGINATSVQTNSTINIDYNTVYLTGTSSGTDFSSAAVSAVGNTNAATASLILRNNILINFSVPTGTGIASAYNRSNANLQNYAAASNNNIFYAGTPSAANVLMYNGTTGYQTLTAYKAAVGPTRDAASLSGDVPFLSTNGGTQAFLHLTPGSIAMGAGVTIAEVTNDFDQEPRTTPTDIGGDEWSTFVVATGIEYFRGYKIADVNFLEWKINVTNEPSVSLSLERSSDGRSFVSIDDQTATAVRCLQGFQYTDRMPLGGSNYYRLKIRSGSGEFRYSSIVWLTNKSKGSNVISLAPNPAPSSAVLSISSELAGKGSISVSDLSGRVIMKQYIMVVAGENRVPLNFSVLPAGTYTISLLDGAGRMTSVRFVKE